MMKPVFNLLAAAALAVCTSVTHAAEVTPDPALVAVVESRSEEDRVRDADRHPVATLTFFQVQPGMTVAETLPGGGWYTRILANYLGGEGTLYGVNYVDRMWPMFSFASEEFIERQLQASDAFAGKVAGFTDNGITAQGFTFNTVPPKAAGTVDRVLMIRSLHNLNRFEANAGTRSQALAAVRAMLKPDGMVGVVQHRLPESHPAEGAEGARGYLKQSDVIAMFEDAGFELAGSSEINANPKDQPSTTDVVWRLPPSLRGSAEDPEQRAAMQAIGESDRMTLLFRRAP